jgi:hypothetical protein
LEGTRLVCADIAMAAQVCLYVIERPSHEPVVSRKGVDG